MRFKCAVVIYKRAKQMEENCLVPFGFSFAKSPLTMPSIFQEALYTIHPTKTNCQSNGFMCATPTTSSRSQLTRFASENGTERQERLRCATIKPRQKQNAAKKKSCSSVKQSKSVWDVCNGVASAMNAIGLWNLDNSMRLRAHVYNNIV